MTESDNGFGLIVGESGIILTTIYFLMNRVKKLECHTTVG